MYLFAQSIAAFRHRSLILQPCPVQQLSRAMLDQALLKMDSSELACFDLTPPTNPAPTPPVDAGGAIPSGGNSSLTTVRGSITCEACTKGR